MESQLMDNNSLIERAFEILKQDQVTAADAQKLGESFSFIATQLQTVTDQLNRIYDLIHDSAMEDMQSIVADLSNDPVSVRQAIEMYNREWFDNLPWPPMVKVELANNLNNLCIDVLGSPSDFWSAKASSLQGS